MKLTSIDRKQHEVQSWIFAEIGVCRNSKIRLKDFMNEINEPLFIKRCIMMQIQKINLM